VTLSVHKQDDDQDLHIHIPKVKLWDHPTVPVEKKWEVG
jgi:hypothetical protein